MRTLRAAFAVLLLGVTVVAEAQESIGAITSPAPLRYTLTFSPATHHIEIAATIPTDGLAEFELMMPVWTPGSYLIREHSRHVEAVRAASLEGRPLPVRKTAKNRWRVHSEGEETIALAYRLYAREMSVRTNWVDVRLALINGAATFMTRIDTLDRPHIVEVRLPQGWRTALTTLAPGDLPLTFVAGDFDTLVDSPIVAGNPSVHEFRVDTVPHALVNLLDDGTWDVSRSVGDLEKIVRYYSQLMGGLPYERYLVFNLLTGAGGGLEHRDSTVLMASRGATANRRRYLNWLSLASHEIFHAWNVKRLRPIELGPLDYERENHTRSLWVAEGLTDYYADLALRRAGLLTDDEYLAELSSQIAALQTTPGRLAHSVEESSFDAWIRQYRPDENSPNVVVSYYTKGSVIGFVLDATIRRVTRSRRSLDDVMRLAFARFSGARGFTPEEFRQVIHEVAGQDLSATLRQWLETTGELDYREALEWFGLHFTSGDPAPGGQVPNWQGLRFRTEGDRLVVSQVRRGTPAYGSGITIGDRILAVNDMSLTVERWQAVLGGYSPGANVTFSIARGTERLEVPFRVGQPEINHWHLRQSAGATAAQQQRLREWLQGTAH